MGFSRRSGGMLALGAVFCALVPVAAGGPAQGAETPTGTHGRQPALEGPETPEARLSLDQMRHQVNAKRVRVDPPGLPIAAALLLLTLGRFVGVRGTGPGRLRAGDSSLATGRAPPPLLALT